MHSQNLGKTSDRLCMHPVITRPIVLNICQKRWSEGCVILYCNLQCGITQPIPILRLFWHICMWLACPTEVKKSRKGRRSRNRKTKRRRRIFPDSISIPASFLLAQRALLWISSESVLFRSAVHCFCRTYLLLGSITLQHGKNWASGTAGHVVMTDDQKFDLMNGRGDSLLYVPTWERRASGRTQNRRHKRGDPRQKFLL